jgi:hypothetical protein
VQTQCPLIIGEDPFFRSLIFERRLSRLPNHLKATMPIPTDKILTECADQAFEAARLRRNGVHPTRDLAFSEMLAQLEASGDAMRYVNCAGCIAWKATTKLAQYFKDLEVDAQDDLGDV